MSREIDIEIVLEMLDALTKIRLMLDSMNKLLIEKGIYTDEELNNICEKLEKESEDAQALKQAMAFLKFFS